MAGNALQVEAVDAPSTPIAAGERGGQSHATAIYWWQIALLAARAGALERELEEVRHALARERRQHQRVIEHYERLLKERNGEIERLEGELASDGDDASGGLGSLFSR